MIAAQTDVAQDPTIDPTSVNYSTQVLHLVALVVVRCAGET